jgi:hypothetical protein
MFLFQKNQQWFKLIVSFTISLLIGVASSYGEELSNTEPPPTPIVPVKENVLEKFHKGFVSPDAVYTKAPDTPMQLKLHRSEQFGIHLHNIGFRYTDQPDLDFPPGQAGSQFQIATSELEFSGLLIPEFLYAQVVIEPRDLLGRGLGDSVAGKIDPKNAPAGIVRDAFFDFLVAEPYLFLRMGQQRIPFGIEVQTPGGVLPFINRAYLDLKVPHSPGAQNTAFGNAEFLQERDIGIQTRGYILDTPRLNYAVGIFNGSGINVNDTNDSKDLVGRMGFAPHPGFRLGFSGYKGNQSNIQDVTVSRDRVGGDIEVTPALIPRFRLMGEGASGQDGPFWRGAWYISGFYELIHQQTPVSPSLWLAVRYDELRDSDTYTRTTIGLTYYFLDAVNASTGYWQQMKFQVNYEVRNHPDSTIAPPDIFAKDLLVAQITARY